jgi:hypothetical protein
VKRKKLSRSKVVKKLDSIFSKYIRQRNAINGVAECFTCGKRDDWKKLQCGHFQSRRFYATRWDETNCQVQCAGCNVFRYGEQFKFSVNLDSRFGNGTSARLETKAKEILKISTHELEDMIKKYQELCD